jgi:diaminopimelate epimerase
MKNIQFWKFQGAGNDFVLLDQRIDKTIQRNDIEQIAHFCDRRFGIGADGLMLLELKPGYDFEMVYFNADGRESSMCGNGGRCIAAFAQQLGLVADHTRFWAIDGEHEASIQQQAENVFQVSLKMSDVQSVEKSGDDYILNTGSPHFIRFYPNIEDLDMVAEGRKIRNAARFVQEGINVNAVNEHKGELDIRTYERGVEDETLACGTGVTAAAIAWHLRQNDKQKTTGDVAVHARGGNLRVQFKTNEQGAFYDIWLSGPAVQVYAGNIQL